MVFCGSPWKNAFPSDVNSSCTFADFPRYHICFEPTPSISRAPVNTDVSTTLSDQV